MNPDELRRLSQDARSRQADEQRKAQERKEQDEQRKRQEAWDLEWERARKAVADLNNAVEQAAKYGHSSAIVYTAHNSLFLNSKTERRERGWWNTRTEWTTKLTTPIPEYAQFVYNSCPRNLNPEWIVWQWQPTTRNINTPSYGSSPDPVLQLRVSW